MEKIEELNLKNEKKCLFLLTNAATPVLSLKTRHLFLKFNTWMNMFAAQKHYYYCDLGNIYLHLDIQGKYRLQVTGSNRNFAFERLDDLLLDTDCENNVCLKIDNAEKYEGLFFTIIEDQNRPITFKSGAWCTDKAPRRQNKLAVVTCTFRREDYINKNIAKFENFLRDNPQLKDKIKLFVSDNGKTLPAALNSENVTIYPNMNAGGAGGFTRGLIEVMKLNAGYTRVLFMDDGKVLEQGSPAQLFGNPQNPRLQDFLSKVL